MLLYVYFCLILANSGEVQSITLYAISVMRGSDHGHTEKTRESALECRCLHSSKTSARQASVVCLGSCVQVIQASSVITQGGMKGCDVKIP